LEALNRPKVLFLVIFLVFLGNWACVPLVRLLFSAEIEVSQNFGVWRHWKFQNMWKKATQAPFFHETVQTTV